MVNGSWSCLPACRRCFSQFSHFTKSCEKSLSALLLSPELLIDRNGSVTSATTLGAQSLHPHGSGCNFRADAKVLERLCRFCAVLIFDRSRNEERAKSKALCLSKVGKLFAACDCSWSDRWRVLCPDASRPWCISQGYRGGIFSHTTSAIQPRIARR